MLLAKMLLSQPIKTWVLFSYAFFFTNKLFLLLF